MHGLRRRWDNTQTLAVLFLTTFHAPSCSAKAQTHSRDANIDFLAEQQSFPSYATLLIPGKAQLSPEEHLVPMYLLDGDRRTPTSNQCTTCQENSTATLGPLSTSQYQCQLRLKAGDSMPTSGHNIHSAYPRSTYQLELRRITYLTRCIFFSRSPKPSHA